MAWLAVLSLGLACSAPRSAALTSYVTDFKSGLAPDWGVVKGTWSLSGGTYDTTGCDPATGVALSIYTGAAWDTNYALRAAVRSRGTAPENTPGLVFNYADAGNYYCLLFDMTGDVELDKVVSGTKTALATASSAYGGGGAGSWEDVEIIRTGDAATVHINGARVFDRVVLAPNPLASGKVGLVNVRNEGSFDHVSVTPMQTIAYSNDFNNGSSAGWSAAAGTWQASVPGATYDETGYDASSGDSIAVCGGSKWDADYTYSASVWTASKTPAAKVGLVFNYADAGDYYELLLNALGAVELGKKISGTLTTIATASTYTGFGARTWIEITLLRRQNGSTSVYVNGRDVFGGVALTELGAGSVGFKATWNRSGRFDDVLVSNGQVPYKRIFPRLAQQFIGGVRAYDLYESTIAQYDLAILSFQNGYRSHGLTAGQIVSAIKTASPATLIANYSNPMESYLPRAHDSKMPDQDVYAKLGSETGPTGNGGTWTPNDWWARDGAGKSVSEWHGTDETNLTHFVTPDSDGLRFPQWYAEREYALIYSQAPYDIWFSDNTFYQPRSNADWNRDGTTKSKTNAAVGTYYRQGLAAYFQRLTLLAPGMFWMGNVDGNGPSRGHLNEPEYQGYVPSAEDQGPMGVRWSEETWNGWNNMLRSYESLIDNSAWPHLVIFNPWGNPAGQSFYHPSNYSGGAKYAFMRCSLCTAMLEDGYFDYSVNGADTVSQTQWFDEYSVVLGHASEGPQRSPWSNGVYKRLFQNGLILVNPRGNGSQTVDVTTLGNGAFKHFTGTQDPTTNNGANVTTVTLGNGDGLVLINQP